MDKRDQKNLKKRYLLRLYKTTKESFDKYELKFSQLEIDEFILLEIEKELKDSYMPSEKKEMEKLVNDFRNYIESKEKGCFKLKYKGKRTNPEFIFLDVKLSAIEKAIEKELGKGGLEEIKALYETEMSGRILKSTED